MAKTVNVFIDGQHLEVPDTMTIIEAADKFGFYIPGYVPPLPPTEIAGSACGMQEILPQRACCTPVEKE